MGGREWSRVLRGGGKGDADVEHREGGHPQRLEERARRGGDHCAH